MHRNCLNFRMFLQINLQKSAILISLLEVITLNVKAKRASVLDWINQDFGTIILNSKPVKSIDY